MARKKAKRGRPVGSKNKVVKVNVDNYLSPASLAATATELKASIKQLNAKLKAINSLMRALKKESK